MNGTRRASITSEPASARFASVDDAEQIVKLLTEMHRESKYAEWPFDHAKLRGMVQGFIGYKDGACIVVQVGDDLVGVSLGLVNEFFFSQKRMASELFHYMRPAHRGTLAEISLAQRFIEWAEATDAVEIHAVGWVGIPDLEAGAFYSGLGFTSSYRTFLKDIPHVRS